VAKITAKAGQILAQEPWSGGAGELRDAGGAALNAPWGLMGHKLYIYMDFGDITFRFGLSPEFNFIF